jgi:4-hydroxyphenylpyruvate dioxygenase-like putative hemolysin
MLPRPQGAEFLEFTASDPAMLDKALRQLGFRQVARRRSKQVRLCGQRTTNFVVNAEPDTMQRVLLQRTELP